MRNRSILKWAVAGIVVLAMVGGSILWYVQPGDAGRRAVATVNGMDISEEELQDYLEQTYGREALETLIIYRLINDAAAKAGISSSEEDVDEEISEMKAEMGEMGFDQFLAQYGMTEEALRYNLLISVTLDELRFSEVQYGEEELQEFFHDNADQFGQEEEVRASHILVEDESLAEEILSRLSDGEDFAELAEAHSLDPGSASQGGDLGFFPRGMMYPEFEEAAFTLEVGDLSEPVQSSAGYHLIKVTERKDARDADYYDVRDDVEQRYLEYHAPLRDDIVFRLYDESNIRIHRPELDFGGL